LLLRADQRYPPALLRLWMPSRPGYRGVAPWSSPRA